MVALSVACVLLAGTSVTEGILYYRLRGSVGELEQQIGTSQSELDEQEKKIAALTEKTEKFRTKLAKREEELAAANERIQELEMVNAQNQIQTEPEPSSEEGRLSPGEGESLFSDSAEGAYVGDIVAEEEAVEHLEQYFTAQTIERGDGIFQRINGKSYQDNENIALEELRYLRVLHYNFDHQIQVGELIVNAQIQDAVLNLFEDLFWEEYEIYSMRLVDDFWSEGMDGNAADYASIDVNNTSAFNYRPVSGGSKLSKHGLGLAIDINPQQNPYVSNGNYSHENAAPYVDRACGDPAVIVPGDICYNTFVKYGFSWGGNWDNPKDYQHFQID